jgi:coenzyme F420-reducing hydrogenase beta subunit
MPLSDPISPRDIVASGLCVGCGGCAAQATADGAHVRFDRFGRLRPDGPKRWFRQRSVNLARTCPSSPAARDEDALALELFPAAPNVDGHIGRFEAAHVGAAAEGDFRTLGSSGGMVTWTAAELMRRGLVDAVAHVKPATTPRGEAPFFAYGVSRSEAELKAGAKSRYYPIEMSAVLDEIRRVPGRYAVVGVPCFIKAVRLLAREDPVLAERIAFTLGLFCGHMKSARMVESFAWQLGTEVQTVDAVDFRAKDPGRPANWYTARLRLTDGSERREDWWHLADGDWGAGFFQYPACNFCDDVTAETADISFGDAWLEPYSSDGRGTNVVVVRSPVLAAIVAEGVAAQRLDLTAVDADFVRETQAAGFRQRREGLSLRLARRRRGIVPRKRVAPGARGLTWRRRAVYLLRQQITAWSHWMFWAARALDRPGLYTWWARRSLAVYQGFAWSQGRVGRLVDRLERKRA